MRIISLGIGAAAVLLCLPLSAQTVSGTLAGHINDSTGAFIPNVTVTAKNAETNLVREGVTNNEGYYALPFLPLGTYEVSASLKGFQPQVKKDVIIDLNRNTICDFAMKPSTVTESVEVTSQTPIIEMAQGDVKATLTQKEVEDTPLAGRNFISLVEQIPGFQNAPWIGSAENPTNSTGSDAVFNGTRAPSTTLQIDGVNNHNTSPNHNPHNMNINSM